MFRLWVRRCVNSLLAATAVGAALLAVVPPSPVSAQIGGYGDVPDNAFYATPVADLAAESVFGGTECETGFCPDEPIDRKTMAVWMVRVLDGSDPPAVSRTRFDDVDAGSFYAPFIERMAELGVTRGCGGGSGFCPDRTVTRAEMAAFISRGYDLPQGPDPGFSDVPSDARYRADAARLAASEISIGCGDGTMFCPEQDTTRAQMATFLWRAENPDWQSPTDEQSPPDGTDITVTGTDNSTRLQVSYDESASRATASWQPSTQEQVDYYVLQWRRVWEEFNSELHQVVDAGDLQADRYSFQIPNFDVYAVRVISVRGTTGAVSAEIEVASQAHRLRSLIKERIVDVYQDNHPWIRDTWQHMNSPKFHFSVYGRGSTAKVYSSGDADGKWASSLTVKPFVLDYFDNYLDVIIHELAHVYTLTNGINENSGPVGIGYLYFHLLILDYPGANPNQCLGHELYADIGRILFFDYEFDPVLGTRDGGGGYWASCGLQLSPPEVATVKHDAVDVAQAAFYGQHMPNWFYRNYQKADGSIDLDKLWADINTRKEYRVARTRIIYHLRGEFGGFCSNEQVRQFLNGQIDNLRQPWRDGGC